MKQEAIRAVLEELVTGPGVLGCSIVETTTGKTWHHTGKRADMNRIGEAAISSWRVQLRMANQFTSGAPHSTALSFNDMTVSLFPCCDDPALVLVCMTENDGNPSPHPTHPLAVLRQWLTTPALL